MSRFRRHRIFFTALALLATIFVGEIVWTIERRGRVLAATQRLHQKIAEYHALAEITPSPTLKMATALDAEAHLLEATLTRLREEFASRGPTVAQSHAAEAPEKRADAFFDLASFVEQNRARAAQLGIGIRAEASRFGFSTYAKESPSPELIPEVRRQRLIVQHVLDALFAAAPNELIAVQREQPVAAAGSGAPAGANASDLFAIDPRLSVRAPKVIETCAFRIALAGQTPALRTFLNQLASSEAALLVRAVEVTPLEKTSRDKSARAEPSSMPSSLVLTADAPARLQTTVPLVPRATSKFVVTIEFVELVELASESSSIASAESGGPAT